MMLKTIHHRPPHPYDASINHSNHPPNTQVHGDVFRAPLHLMLFSAMYGVGWQLALLVLGVIAFAIAGPIHGDVYEEVRARPLSLCSGWMCGVMVGRPACPLFPFPLHALTQHPAVWHWH